MNYAKLGPVFVLALSTYGCADSLDSVSEQITSFIDGPSLKTELAELEQQYQLQQKQALEAATSVRTVTPPVQYEYTALDKVPYEPHVQTAQQNDAYVVREVLPAAVARAPSPSRLQPTSNNRGMQRRVQNTARRRPVAASTAQYQRFQQQKIQQQARIRQQQLLAQQRTVQQLQEQEAESPQQLLLRRQRMLRQQSMQRLNKAPAAKKLEQLTL